MLGRYRRIGECKRCGWCCLKEDPPCPYLQKEDDERYTCLIFDSPDRPVRCGLYPDAPPIIYEECGYSFIDTLESKEVKRVVT